MIRAIVDALQDRYLTWRTGLDRQERTWQQWRDQTIVSNAHTIENMFHNFRYIIPVSLGIFDHTDPLGWTPCEEFRRFLYPARPLGSNSVWVLARGYRDAWDGRFHICDISGDRDQAFVATNSETDAVIIALRWS